jgi:hypothetical protein
LRILLLLRIADCIYGLQFLIHVGDESLHRRVRNTEFVDLILCLLRQLTFGRRMQLVIQKFLRAQNDELLRRRGGCAPGYAIKEVKVGRAQSDNCRSSRVGTGGMRRRHNDGNAQ